MKQLHWLWRYSLWVTLPASVMLSYFFVSAFIEFKRDAIAVKPEQSLAYSTYLSAGITAHRLALSAKLWPHHLPASDVVAVLHFNVHQGDLNALNADLPQSGKQYQSATMHVKGESYRARLRYRGANAVHWRGSKKSLRIKLESEQSYHGIREFDLIIPTRVAMVEGYLALRFAGHLKLLVPRAELAWVILNGVPVGLYLLQENISEQTLINQQQMPGDIYAGDIAEADAYTGVPANLFRNAHYWEKLAHNSNYSAPSKAPLEWLIHLLNEKETHYRRLASIIDYPSFARLHIFNSLVGSANLDDEHNWRLYYDHSIGRFQPIVWDPEGWQSADEPTTALHQLDEVLLRDPRFIAQIQEEWQVIKKNNSLDHFKALAKRTILELEPWVEADPNFTIDLRYYSLTNYRRATKQLLAHLNQRFATAGFPRSESEVRDTASTQTWQGSVRVSGLRHIFSELVIEAGTRIEMAPGANLIFHRSVQFRGSAEAPIYVFAEEISSPFGALTFLDEAHGSLLQHCDIAGGSHYQNSLVNFSGMLNFAGVNGITIDNCRIHDNRDSDDMLYAARSELRIRNSTFSRAYGDALDAELSALLIEGSRFSDNGAEAIDVMASRVNLIDIEVIKSGDNAVSVGQRSYLQLLDSRISQNKTAIVVKDQSYVRVRNSMFAENARCFRAFQRNDHYPGGGEIYFYNSRLDNNGHFGEIEKGSYFYADRREALKDFYPDKKRVDIASSDNAAGLPSAREQKRFASIERYWPFIPIGERH